jgi:hypothetical protein
MTKKDFEFIAKVLRESRPGQGYAQNLLNPVLVAQLLHHGLVAQRFADALAGANPALDKERFLTACIGTA